MQTRDDRDIISSGLSIVGELAASLHASAAYDLGTVGHMGAGMFPAALAYTLAGIGGGILVPAPGNAHFPRRPDDLPATLQGPS